MNRALIDSQRKRRRYYIDQTAGNDGNSGRSPSDAFKTIGQTNGMTFNPGDRISLKRGETWTGECIVVPSNWMHYRDYGTHANQPIVDGNDAANCLTANDIEGLRLQNLHHIQGLDSCAIITTCINVYVVNCEMSDSGNDNLLFIDQCDTCKVQGGHYHDAYKRVADGRLVTNLEITNGSDNITFENVECSLQQDAVGSGIGIHSHDAERMPNNIVVKNCNLHDNVGHGIAIWKQDDTADTGFTMTIQDCQMVDNGENGIQVAKTAPADEHPNGITFSGNYVEGNGNYAYIIQGDNLEIYQNELFGRGYVNGCVDSNFVNNTFFAVGGGGLYSVYIQQARSDGVVFKNNIVFCDVAGGMAIGVANGAETNIDIDYNLYHLNGEGIGNLRWHWLGVSKSYADWLTDSGQDANSPSPGDPLFVSEDDPWDLTLGSGSPAIDAGVDVGLTFLGDAPDCGANELE